MSGPVRLDLNFPEFQTQLFALDAGELRQVVKTFRKLASLTWPQVYADHGLKWEELKSIKGRFTIRVWASGGGQRSRHCSGRGGAGCASSRRVR